MVQQHTTQERRHTPRLESGQSTLEYALFIGVVAAALVTMHVYVRRSIQANLKVLQDQVNAGAVQ